tara:strand:- start:4604 stop:6790 length:2187 start_codon:yes stop_codon:yes gene_type:complete
VTEPRRPNRSSTRAAAKKAARASKKRAAQRAGSSSRVAARVASKDASKRGPKGGTAPQSLADDPLGAPLTELPKLGAARAKKLADAGIATARDLLLTLPRRVVVYPEVISARDARKSVGEEVRVEGMLESLELVRFGGKRSRLRASLRDASGVVDCTWFNQPWLGKAWKRGETYTAFGVVRETKAGIVIDAPRLAVRLPDAGTVEPQYVSPPGVSDTALRGLCLAAVERWGGLLVESLPPEMLSRLDLPDLPTAVRYAHDPPGAAAFEAARRRIAFEPLLTVQARLARQNAGQITGRARPAPVDAKLDTELRAHFPYPFTGGQDEVIAELRRDLERKIPMRRLLQGDVGTGKTAMAAYAAMAVVESGGQVAFMAPTELLAEQHHYGLRDQLKNAGIECALLTGSTPKDERKWQLERLAKGDLHVLFGTHALFSADVMFPNLDLIVIDEQHRFGVAQRSALADKGRDAHLLLLTATPIPRTLALTLYGDLEVSILREAPPGRGSITTRWIQGQKKRSMAKWVGEQLADGCQVYWVLPRIGESETSTGPGAADRFETLSADARLSIAGVELVHGKVPAEERAFRLDRFRRGDIGLLVATTVIEVGVDVPGATIIVIEDAHRLGLAQLHQLRGRVGRGAGDSWCFLMGDKSAAERFELLEKTRDGFVLAEEDLRKRGMGDLAGLRQSGANREGLIDPERDLDLVLAARDATRADPALAANYARESGPRLVP